MLIGAANRRMQMGYPNEIQSEANGPINSDFARRMVHVREKLGLTLSEFGMNLDFSGSFVRGLVLGETRMHSKHADRVLQAVESLEVKAGISRAAKAKSLTPVSDELASYIRHINKLGFSVQLQPITAA